MLRFLRCLRGERAIFYGLMEKQELKVPCAHAPAVLPSDVDESVCPRAAAEELGYTFLPCVLANLHRCVGGKIHTFNDSLLSACNCIVELSILHEF